MYPSSHNVTKSVFDSGAAAFLYPPLLLLFLCRSKEAEGLLAAVWNVGGQPLTDNEKLQLTDMFCCSFGNPVRLDFGTGHECSFAIFLFCLFEKKVLTPEEHDSFAVLGIFKG